ncbi:MAG: carbohydrate kinase family protein [Alphaproteobacteria bacterium]|nr:MAG: carbohydrate kinase family protein [Alphaproteobacteria bacterium]
MKAITIGSAMIDIITLVADESVERMTMHNEAASFLLLEQGRKIDALSITSHVGGGAINTAVSLARQGWDVAAHVRLGQDLNAEKILECMGREHIAPHYVTRCTDCDTGTAVMVSSHDRNATIFTYRGANTRLRPENIVDEMFTGRDLTYIASLSNASADCLPVILDKARAAGSLIAFNPGIRQITSRTGELLDALARIDILILNRVEASALVPGLSARLGAFEPREGPHFTGPGVPILLRTGLEAVGFSLSLMAFARAVRDLGVRWLVVTDGAEGAYVAGKDGLHFCPTLKVEVAGTAGAGDAFASTLAGALAQGMDVPVAMARATVNAASVVSHVDTQKGLLDAAALARLVTEMSDILKTRMWSSDVKASA